MAETDTYALEARVALVSRTEAELDEAAADFKCGHPHHRHGGLD